MVAILREIGESLLFRLGQMIPLPTFTLDLGSYQGCVDIPWYPECPIQSKRSQSQQSQICDDYSSVVEHQTCQSREDCDCEGSRVPMRDFSMGSTIVWMCGRREKVLCRRSKRSVRQVRTSPTMTIAERGATVRSSLAERRLLPEG